MKRAVWITMLVAAGFAWAGCDGKEHHATCQDALTFYQSLPCAETSEFGTALEDLCASADTIPNCDLTVFYDCITENFKCTNETLDATAELQCYDGLIVLISTDPDCASFEATIPPP